MSIVIDASAALAWCFADERSTESQALLEYVSVNGAKVPQIWHLEVANALLVGEIKGRISKSHVREQLDNFDALPIIVDDKTTRNAWSDIFELARQYGLTTYDASYIELAQRLKQPLATRDKAMIAAAKKLGLELVRF